MKNLLVYINKQHRFNPEHKLMLEIQIENAMNYWNLEDIVLCTNFPYEYKGVRSIVGPDTLISSTVKGNDRGIINSEVNAIIYLLKNKLINELTWVHDFDALQINKFNFSIIKKDLAMTTYGKYPPNKLLSMPGIFNPRINFGSIFFQPASLDIFELMLERMESENLYAEDAATLMIKDNINNIADRIQILDTAYNIGMRCVSTNVKNSEKPIKVVHFPPERINWRNKMRYLLSDKLNMLIDQKFSYD